ncbi:uncharacterized protein RAG0_07085 [Rhynchosporium agropyri]|uniref:Uncharacterized protein n=1 Tax=Rhynchosporium agropyri TaxID=914238 RepID=A0A1E1KN57_9HELO|nr:uncharacterized protein RAG0_07085 [Rhynchosporium agropyri]
MHAKNGKNGTLTQGDISLDCDVKVDGDLGGCSTFETENAPSPIDLDTFDREQSDSSTRAAIRRKAVYLDAPELANHIPKSINLPSSRVLLSPSPSPELSPFTSMTSHINFGSSSHSLSAQIMLSSVCRNLQCT